jgi:hypothetical protein
MADYNIIYIVGGKRSYLWNGSSFDLLSKKENEKLLFSGKSYTEDELPDALQLARKAAKQNLPLRKSLRLKQVQIPVNNTSEFQGHSPHIPS